MDGLGEARKVLYDAVAVDGRHDHARDVALG